MVREIPLTPAQRQAVEAPLGPVLVLAGPGAGKTHCLISRIGYLVKTLGIAPDRIRAFTFTNRAAEEIGKRLQDELGPAVDTVARGTMHAFCSWVLREWGFRVGVERGFGIADDDYQREVLRRFRYNPRWQTSLLTRFGLHRFAGEPLHPNDVKVFERYQRFLAHRNLVDFDTLVIKTAELLDQFPATRAEIASRWDYLLVDEFQDMDRVQYRIVRYLAEQHRNLFIVGDEEQSIYSWRGANPELFKDFLNDFGAQGRIILDQNHRCPKEAFTLARALVTQNPPLWEVKAIRAERLSGFPVAAYGFGSDADEAEWLVADLERDHRAAGLSWGEYALLYRKHEIGDFLEATLLKAGIPCRLALGRSLTDDPVVAYVIAALKVVARPVDTVVATGFMRVVLPKALMDALQTGAEQGKSHLIPWMRNYGKTLPPAHEDGRKIRRALYAWQNLPGLASRHHRLSSLIEELLSQRVGEYRNALEERQDELSDPASHYSVRALAERLRHAKEERRPVAIPRLGGLEIPLRGMLRSAGFSEVTYPGAGTPVSPDAERIEPGIIPELGLALGLFKALQLAASTAFHDGFEDFVAFDLETTDRDTKTAEIVEIAAVRVRNGVPVAEWHSLVRPQVAIAAKATEVHGFSAADLADQPTFEEIWPGFREFIGTDLLVAHNGYQFDLPILKRMSKSLEGGGQFTVYDSLPLARDLHTGSAKLEDLARYFGIDAGTSHRALDDTRTLARVFRKLQEAKFARSRRTALANLLDHLGVALALSEADTTSAEAAVFRDLSRAYALGRYSECLEFYRAEAAESPPGSVPPVDEVIERLGGVSLMLKIRADKGADQRYPAAMARLRRLVDDQEAGTLAEQVGAFLEKVALSKSDGYEADEARVNLLTLHSTKGLEFSRVYIVGAEDGEMLRGSEGKEPAKDEVEEARRLVYVGMTRVKDRLVFTRAEKRGERLTGGYRFLGEMGLIPKPPG